MASRGNQHCANCTGTPSFPIKVYYSGREASDVSMSCFSIITIIVNDCWRLNDYWVFAVENIIIIIIVIVIGISWFGLFGDHLSSLKQTMSWHNGSDKMYDLLKFI